MVEHQINFCRFCYLDNAIFYTSKMEQMDDLKFFPECNQPFIFFTKNITVL